MNRVPFLLISYFFFSHFGRLYFFSSAQDLLPPLVIAKLSTACLVEMKAITEKSRPSSWNDVDTSCNHPAISEQTLASNRLIITGYRWSFVTVTFWYFLKSPADAQLYQKRHLTFVINHFQQRHRECNFNKSAAGDSLVPLRYRLPAIKIDHGGDLLKLDKAESWGTPLFRSDISLW